MPGFTPNDVQNEANALQNGKLKEIEEQIGSLEAGDTRRLAEMTLESAQVVLKAATSGHLDNKSFPLHFARMYYTQQVRDGKQSLTSAEVEEKAAALAGNTKFLKVFADKRGPDDCMNAIHSFFGGPRENHLDSWVKECEQSVTRDYGQEFEVLCGDTLQGAEREAAKQHFVNMGTLNEEIRALDYEKALSPDQMYTRLTSETLQAEKAATNSINKVLTEKGDLLQQGVKMRSTLPQPASIPPHLARFAHFFFDYSNSPEAAEKNQQLVNRLHSDDPADKEFQAEFTINCINKMLAVPEEALCPKTPEQAAKALGKHYYEMRALQESSNFLKELTKQYNLPDYVKQTLMHKGDLYMQNVEKYVKRTEIDPNAYEELSLLEGYDSAAISKIGEKLLQRNDPLGSSVLAYTAVAHDLKQDKEILPNVEEYDKLYMRARDLSPVKEGAQATASDSFFLTPDSVQKPKAPGAWASFWHTFGFYKEEFNTYQQNLEKYEKWVKEHPQNKAFIKDAAFGANGANAENMEKEFEKKVSLGDLAKEASADYKKTLDKAFGQAEKQTEGRVDRLDYVMIGPKSLRAILQEEYLKTHAECQEFTSPNGTELEEYCNESLKNGHAYELLARADLQHVSVQYASLNDKAELKSDNGKITMTSFACPECIKKLSSLQRSQFEAESEKEFAKKGMNLKEPASATERMHLMDNSRAALYQLNAWQHVEGVCDKSEPKVPKEGNVFSLNDAAFHGLKEAYLLCTYAEPLEQVYNAEEQIPLKKSVEGILQEKINDPESAKGLASVAVEGIQKIKDLVDDYTKGMDLSKEICSPKMKKVAALVSTASALYKGISGNEALKAEAGKAWAKQHHMNENDPEQVEKASQSFSVCSTHLVGLDTAMKQIMEGRQIGCRFCAGAVAHTSTNTGKIFAGEMALKVISERVKADTPLSESMPLSEAAKIETWSLFAIASGGLVKGEGQEALHNLCMVKKPIEGVKFASYAMSGGLAHDCQIKVGGTSDAFTTDLGATFAYTPPTSETMGNSVVEEPAIEQDEPTVDQNMLE